MSIKLRKPITELLAKLEAEGKLTIISGDVAQEIQDEIDNAMEEFRQLLARKEAQSIDDTRKIIVQ